MMHCKPNIAWHALTGWRVTNYPAPGIRITPETRLHLQQADVFCRKQNARRAYRLARAADPSLPSLAPHTVVWFDDVRIHP